MYTPHVFPLFVGIRGAAAAASVVDDVVVDEQFAPGIFSMYVRVNLYDS